MRVNLTYKSVERDITKYLRREYKKEQGEEAMR